jgi:molybdopterin molybdotransferase
MPIPTGLQAVVPIERIRPSDGWLDIQGVVRAGDHIRRAGEEIEAGERAVPAGTRINPATIGLLLALGHGHVPVCAAPRVGILVTGEELFAGGGPRPAGAVVDSNGPMLEALVAGAGGVIVERLLVTDDPAAIQHSLERLAAECHLVITSGGASVGTRDHLVPTVRASGELLIHQLDMKPGRPTSLGLIDGTPIVLLPGNPLAALIGFEAIGRPIIRSLAGDPVPLRPRVAARALGTVAHKPGRLECVPVQVSWVGGYAGASPLDHRGSGMLRGASLADGVAILGADQGAAIEGDELALELWA